MKHLLITAFLLFPMLSFAVKTKYDPKTGKIYEVKTLSKNLLPKWKMKKHYNYIPSLKNQEYTTAPSGELYLPAEFAKMEAVLIQPGLWDTASVVYYKEMVKALYDAGVTPYIITKNATEISDVTSKLLTPLGLTASDVRFLMYEYDAVWTRDYGPWDTYVDGDRVIVDMKYFPDRTKDDNVPILLGAELDEDVYKTDLSTEGGNFMSDGFGSCWISNGVQTYNPSLSVDEIKAYYTDYVGCNTVTIVPPLPDEGTTHIDMFSKVLNQDTILVGFSTIAYGAEQKEISQLDAVAEIYKNSPKPDGKKWNIIRIPMTFDTYYDDYYQEYYRVYYTHTNALVVNNHVLVPTYGRGTDAEALEIYKKALPEYTIDDIDANAFIPYGGALHCMTMQIPVKQEVICGNGIIEEDKGESCEDNYLGGKTCKDFGFNMGELKCNDCQIDSSDCTYPDQEILSDNQYGVCKGQLKVFSETELDWVEPDFSLIDGFEHIEVTCDGLDNDCDGKVDNNLETNLLNVNQKGVCENSKMLCHGVDGWQEDYTQIADYKKVDDNNDGLDNNCDGQIDESKSTDSSSCNYQSSSTNASVYLFLLVAFVFVIRRKLLKL